MVILHMVNPDLKFFNTTKAAFDFYLDIDFTAMKKLKRSLNVGDDFKPVLACIEYDKKKRGTTSPLMRHFRQLVSGKFKEVKTTVREEFAEMHAKVTRLTEEAKKFHELANPKFPEISKHCQVIFQQDYSLNSNY